MRAVKISAAFLLIALFYGNSFSQVGFSLGPSTGVTFPEGDYSGTTVDFYNGSKYGLSSGFNLGVLFKIKLPVIRIRVAGNYSLLKNTGNSETDKPNSYIEVKQSLFMLSGGPEFVFSIPASMVKPYAGLDLLISMISGETTFNGVSRVSSGTYSMSSATRIGIGLGAGVEFSIGKKYAVDVGLRYNMINLIGRNFEELPSNERLDSYINLNDEQDPNYAVEPDKHPVSTSRSISTIQLNAAFLFGF